MRGMRAGVAGAVAVGLVIAGCGREASDGASVIRDGESPTTTEVAVGGPCAEGAPAVAFTGPSYEEGGDLFVVDGPGEVRQLSDDGGTYSPSFSPDGSEVVVSSIGEEGEVSDSFGPSHLELVVVPTDGGKPQPVGTTGFATDPAWSPDGTQIAFSRTPDGESAEPPELWVIGADGTGERRLVDPEPGYRDEQPAWSPDGRQLAFVRSRRDDRGEQGRLVVATVADGEVTGTEVVLDEGGWLSDPAFSPDGTRLAVVGAQEGGGARLQVIDLPSGDVTASQPGTFSPAWAADGRLLAYGRAPGVSDASGSDRVAEFAPEGDGFAVGLPVPGTEVVGNLYGGYRVAVPRCEPGVGPLTDGVEPVGTIVVTVPSTGETVTVLDREAVSSALDQVVGPEAWTPPVRSKLIEPAQLGTRSAEPVDGGPPQEFPLFDAGDEPLVWVVCDPATCAVVQGATGSFLMGGGSLGEVFDGLADLAPS